MAEEIVTRYGYNALGEIIQVTDAHGHTTEVDYDLLGRRRAIDNPDTGRVEMVYDKAGNLRARITPKLREQKSAIVYDYDYTRLKAIDYPNADDIDVTYTYGAAAERGQGGNRVGRITKVTHQGGFEARWYGKLGEMVREEKTIHVPPKRFPSGSKFNQGATQPEEYAVFITQYDYDSFGRLYTLSYPDGETLHYRYNAGGLPDRVDGSYKGSPYTYVQRLGYDKFEQRVRLELGNGAVSDYSYDPASRRLAGLTSASDGQTFQNLVYGYDKVGNITTLANDIALPQDGHGGKVSQSFGYDHLYRLTSAAGEYQRDADTKEAYTLAMQYNAIHNIERKTQTHTLSGADGGTGTKHGTSYDWAYRYNGPQPHAPTHIGERTFHYDANGNQEGWNHDKNNNRRTITWDDADRIQSIEDRGGETSQYAYDDQGQRVIKQARQGVTLYVNQFFTERNGSVGSKHVFVGTTRLVTKVTGGTNFIRSYDGYTESKTPPGQLKRLDQPGKTKPVKDQPDQSDNGKHLGQQKSAATPTQGSHPGQGIYRRADRANEVAQNTCKNKHLAADHCAEEGAGGETPSTSTDTTDTTTSEAGTSPDEAAVFEISPPDLFDEDGSAAYAELIKVSMGEQLFYYHPDHLGSTSYVTRENGKIHEHIQYFPFGETWIQQGGNTEKSPYLFTSKELDEETGLYYYGARYYDPRTNVWQSVDPILEQYLPGRGRSAPERLAGIGGVYNSRNLGLFSYVGANPLKFIDPDGRKLVFAEGSSPEFKAKFGEMIQYLNKGKVSGPIARLHARPETVYVKEGSSLNDFYYDLDSNTIVIHPESGLQVSAETDTSPAQVQSPALGLLHEVGHALQHLENPEQLMEDFMPTGDAYGNYEEKRVIQNIETPAAKKLGEPTRDGHSGPDMRAVRVECPTCNTPVE